MRPEFPENFPETPHQAKFSGPEVYTLGHPSPLDPSLHAPKDPHAGFPLAECHPVKRMFMGTTFPMDNVKTRCNMGMRMHPERVEGIVRDPFRHVGDPQKGLWNIDFLRSSHVVCRLHAAISSG
jgi:hypothetical protein